MTFAWEVELNESSVVVTDGFTRNALTQKFMEMMARRDFVLIVCYKFILKFILICVCLCVLSLSLSVSVSLCLSLSLSLSFSLHSTACHAQIVVNVR